MEHATAVAHRKSAAGGPGPELARKSAGGGGEHPIMTIQRTAGNQAAQRLLRSANIQAKVQVSRPGDKFEQEADRTSDKVMRAGDSAPPAISRVAHEAQRAEAPLQRSSRSPLREHTQPSVRDEPSRSSLRSFRKGTNYSAQFLREFPEGE